jgi:hypothetical protein
MVWDGMVVEMAVVIPSMELLELLIPEVVAGLEETVRMVRQAAPVS